MFVWNGNEWVNGGSIQGPAGSSGISGIDGTSGINGVDGTSGVDGVDGQNGTSGINGVDGQNGTSGINGVDGQNGTSGINGVDGTSGVDGVDGQNGTSGINGVDGQNGTSGINGVDGTSGINGVDGQNGTSGINGIDGQEGPRGEVGPQGIQGESAFKVLEFFASGNEHYKVGPDTDYVNQANNVNPTLTLSRGEFYKFKRGDAGHPLDIKDKDGNIIFAGIQSGSFPVVEPEELIWKIPQDATGPYTYVCSAHPAMTGTINICCVGDSEVEVNSGGSPAAPTATPVPEPTATPVPEPTATPLPAGWISQAPGTFNFGEDLDAYSNRGQVWMRKDSNNLGAGNPIDFSSDPESTLGNLRLYFTNSDVGGKPGYTHFEYAHIIDPYYLCIYKDADNYAVIDVTALAQGGSPTSYLQLQWDYVRGKGSVGGELEAIGFVETDFGWQPEPTATPVPEPRSLSPLVAVDPSATALGSSMSAQDSSIWYLNADGSFPEYRPNPILEGERWFLDLPVQTASLDESNIGDVFYLAPTWWNTTGWTLQYGWNPEPVQPFRKFADYQPVIEVTYAGQGGSSDLHRFESTIINFSENPFWHVIPHSPAGAWSVYNAPLALPIGMGVETEGTKTPIRAFGDLFKADAITTDYQNNNVEGHIIYGFTTEISRVAFTQEDLGKIYILDDGTGNEVEVYYNGGYSLGWAEGLGFISVDANPYQIPLYAKVNIWDKGTSFVGTRV